MILRIITLKKKAVKNHGIIFDKKESRFLRIHFAVRDFPQMVMILREYVMKRHRRNRTRRGILTFEWMLLFTVLVIGVVGAFSFLQTATIVECRDAAMSFLSFNPSYNLSAPVELDMACADSSDVDPDNRIHHCPISTGAGSVYNAGTFNIELEAEE